MSSIPTQPPVPIPTPNDPHTEAQRVGLFDGALGKTWREYRKILEHQAEQRRVEDFRATQKQLETQSAEWKLAHETEADVRLEYDRVEAHYRMVADDKDRKPSSYSGPWGLLFVLLAFVLVGADFPLTRQIVSAMAIGSDANWTAEQVMVSIGIVAMSLFFKLLTDPFTQPQYLMGTKRRIVMQVISGVLFLGLMGGVVAMLILLGMFRAGAIGSDAAAAGGLTVTSTAPATSTAAPASAVDLRLRALEAFRDQTFIMMSLILPIIGGIFASVGMARIHNASRFRYLRRERHRLRYILDEAARKAHTAAAAVRSLHHDLTAITQRVAVAGGEYHSYLHAYQAGLCKPDLERGHIGMATRLRDVVEKWTAIVDQSQNLVRTESVSDSVEQSAASAEPPLSATQTNSDAPSPSVGVADRET